jgi:succinate dehydrogenase/fumarate reductase cytochrome b subunit
MWSWVLHRITGIAIFFFLLVHVLDTRADEAAAYEAEAAAARAASVAAAAAKAARDAPAAAPAA